MKRIKFEFLFQIKTIISRKTSISVILIFLTVAGFSQKTKPATEVTIDDKTHLPDKLCPFDEYFLLNLPVDSVYSKSDIMQVSIYRAKYELKKSGGAEIKEQKKYIRTNTIGTVSAHHWVPFQKWNANGAYGTNIEIVDFEKKGAYNSIKGVVPPLVYGKNYLIDIMYLPSSAWLSGLHEVNQLLLSNDNIAATKYQLLSEAYTEFNKDRIERLGAIDIISFQEYQNYFNKNLRSSYEKLMTTVVNTTSITSAYKSLFDAVSVCDLCATISQCNCHEQSIGEEVKNQLPAFLTFHCFLSRINNNDSINNVASNRITIENYLSGTSIKNARTETDLDEMIKNSAASLQFVKNLNDLYHSTTLTKHLKPECKDNLIKCIENILKQLDEKNDQIKALKKSVDQSVVNIFKNLIPITDGENGKRFIFGKFLDINSDIADLKTASGNFVIPDLGFALLIPSGLKDNTVMLRPYVGVNISFKPINKNIRFRDIPNRNAGNFLSISIGLTYWPINKSHTDIKDLFDGTSLLGGLNLRLTRGWRIGFGSMLYYKDNPNPVLKQNYALMPYFSTSLDLDIVSFLEKITERIIK